MPLRVNQIHRVSEPVNGDRLRPSNISPQRKTREGAHADLQQRPFEGFDHHASPKPVAAHAETTAKRVSGYRSLESTVHVSIQIVAKGPSPGTGTRLTEVLPR